MTGLRDLAVGTMNELERDAYRRWRAGASHIHFGLCHGCDRTHDAAGKPLLVARQRRARRFLCLQCWDMER